MGNMFKRFLAILMATMMVMSCTPVASATESKMESNNGKGQTSAEFLRSAKGIQIIQEGETPEEGAEKVYNYRGNFKLETEKYITMIINTRTEITVTLAGILGNALDVGVIKKFEIGTNGQYTIYYIGGKFPTGEYIYNISIRIPEAPYAFYLVATDYPYN